VWPRDPTSAGCLLERSAAPGRKGLYFTVENLEATFDRAKALSCQSREHVHDAPAGGIVVRPCGERSFYAEDPWGNPLCSSKRELFTRGSDVLEPASHPRRLGSHQC